MQLYGVVYFLYVIEMLYIVLQHSILSWVPIVEYKNNIEVVPY